MKMKKETFKKFSDFLKTIPSFHYSAILLIVSSLLFIPTDPDFFWHLKYGELTLKEGPISHNPFSYTFADYKFVDFEWLSNTITFLLYKIGQFHLVSLFYGLIVFFALLISLNTNIRQKVSKESKSLMLLLGIVAIYPVIGVRPQMISLLGLALTYFLLIKYLKNQSRTIFLIPLLILLWTNLHPGFLSGLILISTVIVAELIKRVLRKIKVVSQEDTLYGTKSPKLRILYLVIFLSFIATIFTPYFYKILQESVLFSFDSYAQDHIIEWLAPNFHWLSGKLTMFYMLVVIVALFRRRNLNLTEVLVILIFAIMTFQSIRHLPLFVIVSIPSVLACKDLKRISALRVEDSFIFLLKGLTLFTSLGVFFLRVSNFLAVNAETPRIYAYTGYPYKAVNFLKEKDTPGNILNNYEWGGFLIWEYPEKKTFIDGRMTSWRIDGESILKEYLEIKNLNDRNWKQKLADYQINTVFIDPSAPLGNALREDTNWEIVYEDKISVVFIKKT